MAVWSGDTVRRDAQGLVTIIVEADTPLSIFREPGRAAGEVAASVFDRYRDDTYLEASFKPYIIAAMIVLGKFAERSPQDS